MNNLSFLKSLLIKYKQALKTDLNIFKENLNTKFIKIKIFLLTYRIALKTKQNFILKFFLPGIAIFFIIFWAIRPAKFLKKHFGIGGPPVLKVETYRIQPNETLWNLAKEKNISIDALITLNKLNNVHSLRVGQQIIIPNQDGIQYTVKSGETIRSIAEKFKIKIEDLIDVNDLNISPDQTIYTNLSIFLPNAKLSQDERMEILGIGFLIPVNGGIKSGYGWRLDPVTKSSRQFHTGIDFACSYGTPVKAAQDGKVVFSGDKGGYGKTIILRHPSGYTTIYAHLSKASVNYGEYVKQGEIIGYSGNSGRTTGPHLHFEIRRYGITINPSGSLRAKK